MLLFCSELFTVKELQYGNTKFADNDHVCNLKIQASRDLDFTMNGILFLSIVGVLTVLKAEIDKTLFIKPTE